MSTGRVGRITGRARRTGPSTGRSVSSTAGCAACETAWSATPPCRCTSSAAAAGGPPIPGRFRAPSSPGSTCEAGDGAAAAGRRRAQRRCPSRRALRPLRLRPRTRPSTYWLHRSLWELARAARRPPAARGATRRARVLHAAARRPSSRSSVRSRRRSTSRRRRPIPTSPRRSSTCFPTASPSSCRRASCASAAWSSESSSSQRRGRGARARGRHVRHRPPVRDRARGAARGVEQQLRALRPQPQHGRPPGTDGAASCREADRLPRSPATLPPDPAGRSRQTADHGASHAGPTGTTEES